MMLEPSSSSFSDQNWELQRPWATEEKDRVGGWRRAVGLPFLLAISTVLVYAQACWFGSVSMDDSTYVTSNANVQEGLTWRNVEWSFTTLCEGNWLPLTWLSLMADRDLFGAHLGGFHLTNIVLHTLNTLLLFVFLARATGQRAPSALVSALFALHPLHVESVAWIAERKDVLSSFFGLLSLLAYLRYATRGSRWSLLGCFLLFVCSLMAKQTLVTLPFVFLLLDYWPFDRIRRSEEPTPARDLEQPERAASSARRSVFRVSGIWLLVEKIPFLLVSAAVSAVVVAAQSRVGAVRNLAIFPLWVRLANAAVAYVAYLGKAFFPHNLAIYYPHPGLQLSGSDVSAAAAILAAVTVCAMIWWRRHPYLLVGWAWYLGTLVPMIGIVQVGSQQMADRYTYFPLIGLFIALVWTVRSLVSPFAPAGSLRAGLVRAAAISIVVVLAVTTCVQIGYWRDFVTLCTHALSSTADSAFMENQLGGALLQQGRAREALEHLELAARSDPAMRQPQYNLGIAFAQLGRFDQAVVHLRAALAINDGYSAAHYQLGLVENELGHYAEAQEHLRRTIEIDPELVDAHVNLAVACLKSGDNAGAISSARRALELQPGLTNCHRIIAQALDRQGRSREAIGELQDALRRFPNDAGLHDELARLLGGSNRRDVR
jgi:protein O-mannosyl-transferase